MDERHQFTFFIKSLGLTAVLHVVPFGACVFLLGVVQLGATTLEAAMVALLTTAITTAAIAFPIWRSTALLLRVARSPEGQSHSFFVSLNVFPYYPLGPLAALVLARFMLGKAWNQAALFAIAAALLSIGVLALGHWLLQFTAMRQLSKPHARGRPYSHSTDSDGKPR